MIRTIHRAKHVLAEADLLLQNAAVHVSSPGRISRIEPWHHSNAHMDAEVIDWGRAVILPGLINAHTHLELTHLHNRLTRFSSFTDWISQLVRERSTWRQVEYLASTHDGVQRSLASGTTLVGDISASGFGRQSMQCAAIRSVVFEEAIGFAPDGAVDALQSLNARLDLGAEGSELTQSGVSPHAPYSVSSDLYRFIAGIARSRRIPLATHIAETMEELQFLRSGTGEFAKFLSGLGVLPSDWSPPGLAPVLYLDSLGVLQQPGILVHCNYLDRESMARIQGTRSSVVYCPRSHAFFGHKNHPVRHLMDSGINVALGTDSLASNDSLSILDEMRFLFDSRKDLKGEEIFRMATLNGAAALQFGGVLGRLRRGYLADMTILRLDEEIAPRNLLAGILGGAGKCIATIVGGRTAWQMQ